MSVSRCRGLGLLSLLLPWVGAACSPASAGVSLVFPDEAAQAATKGFLFTAVEPFVPAPEDSGRQRVLLNCGQLTVFPPTAKVSRDVTDLSLVSALRGANREPRDFPFKDAWDLTLDQFTLGEDSNPWRAVLLHFEARGDVRRSDPTLAESEEERTIMEGCTCVRLREQGSSGDPLLDAEVEASCPWIGAEGQSAQTVVLSSVAPPTFRLEACGVTDLTAPRGRQIALAPGVCLNTTECNPQRPEAGCFKCSNAQCVELTDRKNVAVSVSVVPPDPLVKVTAPLILTGKAGRVVPELKVEGCEATRPITVRVALLGRPGEPVDFKVRCTAPIDFAEDPTERKQLGTPGVTTSVLSVSAVPATPGASPEKARIAVLLAGKDMPPTTILELWGEKNGDTEFKRLRQLEIPGRGLGVFGYHYRVARAEQAGGIPLLAVATGEPGAGRSLTQVVQIFRLSDTPAVTGTVGVTLRRVAEMRGDCRRTACGGQRLDACQEAPCKTSMPSDYTSVTQVSFAAADQDGDGYAELFVGSDRLFPLHVFRSVAQPAPGEMEPLPRELSTRCQCQSVGRALPFFALGQLGGPGDTTGLSSLDMVMGDGTGAYVRYGDEVVLDGRPCSATPDASGPYPDCAAGQECVNLACALPGGPLRAPVETQRCLTPCSPTDPQSCGGNTSLCRASAAMGPSGSSFYCGTPAVGCSSPNAVWKLVTVHDVAVGRVGGSPFGDVVAVGAGSPVPGFAGGGVVRVFFGGDRDLTRLDSAQTADRLAASVDLIPRRLKKSMDDAARSEEPQGPRAARIGDFNQDGIDDLAVLFTTTEEIRVWLGSAGRAPGEIGEKGTDDKSPVGGRVRLNGCKGVCEQRLRCFPHPRFVVADVNGDGQSEIAAFCSPESPQPAELKLFYAVPQ